MIKYVSIAEKTIRKLKRKKIKQIKNYNTKFKIKSIEDFNKKANN